MCESALMKLSNSCAHFGIDFISLRNFHAFYLLEIERSKLHFHYLKVWCELGDLQVLKWQHCLQIEIYG